MNTEKNALPSSGFYFGSVEFEGLGGYREKMVSELFEKGIAVRGITLSEVGIRGCVSPADYLQTAEIARKNGVKIRAGKRRGLYFLLSRYRHRIGLYAGLLIFALSLSLWQTHVQDITITGEGGTAQIMQILTECGIVKGARTEDLKLYMAEHRIMLEVDNCAWADVSCEGFRVNVHVEKGIEVPEMETDEPRNIIASRPAKIVSQTVRKGASTVQNGSGVNTGDMLVSGIFPDDGGHLMTVHADAEIIGEWQEETEFFVPYRETINVPDGEQKTYKYLLLGNDVYPLFWGKPSAENSLYTEETRKVTLFGEDTPLKVKTGTYTAYTEKTITRSPETTVSELQKQKENYEQNFYSKLEIVNCEEKYYTEENGVRLVLEYTLQGDIAKPAIIEFGENYSES